LAIEVDFNLPAPRVVRTLDRIAAVRGYPRKLRLDNGPEMVSVTLADWAEQHHVRLEFIKPGRPMQNGFIERIGVCQVWTTQSSVVCKVEVLFEMCVCVDLTFNKASVPKDHQEKRA
jgi:transposase InsO family protein